MVDGAVLLAVIRVVGCAVAVPGLVTWALILYMRRMRGIAILVLVFGILFVCALFTAADYKLFSVEFRGYVRVVTTFLIVIVAVVTTISLRKELGRNQWTEADRIRFCGKHHSRDKRTSL